MSYEKYFAIAKLYDSVVKRIIVLFGHTLCMKTSSMLNCQITLTNLMKAKAWSATALCVD